MVEVKRDPEEVEKRYLQRLAEPAGARVLEVGCGDGRLIWRYAATASSVYGVDPDASRLSDAIQVRPDPLVSKVYFALAKGEALPFGDETFDLTIMGWSL